MSGVPLRKADSDEGPRNRLVGCQGSIQLVTAIAACRHRDQTAPGNTPHRNWLVIHDLHAPRNQDAEFADCLRRIALSVGDWEDVIYLSPDQIHELSKITRHVGYTATVKLLGEWLNVPEMDEVYLSQNRVLVNDLFGKLFHSATKTCYGDGIGVNFSPEYFLCRPPQTFAKKLRRAITKPIQRLFRGNALPPIQFDKHSLLLPNRFDEVLSQYEQLDRALVLQIFERIQEAMRPELTRIMSDWSSIIRDAPSVVVLLTSNFSEAGRMPEDREVEAYVDLVRAQMPTEGAAILVKPHPRDSASKISRLRDSLLQSCPSVFVLNDPLSFYLPFEVILRASILADEQLAQRTRVICVSSACLSLELLYGIRCELGFGERVVREHFVKSWKELRGRHEFDLRTAVHQIRKRAAIRQAA
jgi:hypothetical protein